MAPVDSPISQVRLNPILRISDEIWNVYRRKFGERHPCIAELEKQLGEKDKQLGEKEKQMG